MMIIMVIFMVTVVHFIRVISRHHFSTSLSPSLSPPSTPSKEPTTYNQSHNIPTNLIVNPSLISTIQKDNPATRASHATAIVKREKKQKSTS
ncbi:hypothetical protein BZA77DRAFT_313130 [Pyronema omphalodes]|nr:hypothetical protein BZA77DRAFT_313130 [Pyronema omphalodes]